MVRKAVAEGPALPAGVSVDVRMPPGWDGIETVARSLAGISRSPSRHLAPPYSDYSWEDMLKNLGRTDRLRNFEKPFEVIGSFCNGRSL